MTAEWFEARKEQLQSLQSKAAAEAESLFICPLTNKKFQSEGTYESHTRTKKFKAALKKAGLTAAPPPRVVAKTQPPPAAAAAADVSARAAPLVAVAEAEGSSASDWETDDEAGSPRSEVGPHCQSS